MSTNSTAQLAVGSPVVSSLSNARWQYVPTFTNTGGSYLMMVNGADKLRKSMTAQLGMKDGDGAALRHYKRRYLFIAQTSTYLKTASG
jgi:hypothetical protein